MAIGFSGSNGGITQNSEPISAKNLTLDYIRKFHTYPLEVSYFINNTCNLKCRHCYVGYEQENNALTIDEWESLFDECIELGGLTFGNVGKEPTLDWEKTIALLEYFKAKREQEPKLRFGLVTNAILLDSEKTKNLCEINPTYIDISLDGNEEVHDAIRGRGSYSKTMANIKSFPQNLLDKVFISFTINRLNLNSIPKLIDDIYKIGIKNILISPYVSNRVAKNINNDDLCATDEDIAILVEKLLHGELINFDHYNGLNIYVKNDYSTSLSLMKKFVGKKIINMDNLNIDEYGVIFTKYTFNNNNIYFNYLPWDNYFVQAIRISHDGFISNCYDMFFKDYPYRALGNVKKESISKILKSDGELIHNKELVAV